MLFDNEDSLLSYAREIEGRKISEISQEINAMDVSPRKHTKGLVAKVIETDYFGILRNSRERPDFEELGIELKVSPIRFIKRLGWYTTKERLVLSMVDYNEIQKVPIWSDLKLFKKLKRVLFVLYFHDNSVPAMDWEVKRAFLWSPSILDSAVIQNDYWVMRHKVLNGSPLREGDCSFLATCPKHGGGYLKKDPLGSPRKTLAEHPVLGFAEKRGYCIKREAFINLIANAISVPLLESGRSAGIKEL